MAVSKITLQQTATTSEAAVQKAAVDYTPAGGKVFSIVSLWIHNKNAAAKYCILKVGTTILVGAKQIPANDTLILDGVNLYLAATEKIYIQGEVANDLQVRINGLEVDA